MPRRRTYPGLKSWTAALETAARARVQERVPPALRDSCLVQAEPCAKHGSACACVTYGMLRSHFVWAEHDPARLAEQLVGTMLPRNP